MRLDLEKRIDPLDSIDRIKRNMEKKFEIRNSTPEFLTFVAEGNEQGIQVFYKDETVWATQKAMAQLLTVQQIISDYV